MLVHGFLERLAIGPIIYDPEIVLEKFLILFKFNFSFVADVYCSRLNENRL